MDHLIYEIDIDGPYLNKTLLKFWAQYTFFALKIYVSTPLHSLQPLRKLTFKSALFFYVLYTYRA